jgi:hypothetical protein
MQYTDSEICALYRDAKDKAKQIKILAELNNCSPDEIREVLSRHGAEIQACARMKWTPLLIDRVLALRKEGLTHAKIAYQIGATEKAVRNQLVKIHKKEGEKMRKTGAPDPTYKIQTPPLLEELQKKKDPKRVVAKIGVVLNSVCDDDGEETMAARINLIISIAKEGYQNGIQQSMPILRGES